MKNILSLFIFIGLISLTSCAHRKNAEKIDQQAHQASILVDDFDAFQNSAATNITSAKIEDNLLKLSISYSGGCEKHSFELVGLKMIQKSLPPKRAILLYHNSNGDSCRELVEEELTFDITNFAYDKNEIQLILEGFELPIPYTLVD